MKVLKWLDNNLEKYVCVILLMVIAGFTFVNVVMRYVFKNGISWATEGTLFLFAFFVWFTISYGFKMRSHVNVTAITGMLPAKAQRILAIIVEVVELAGLIYIAYWGLMLIFDKSVIGKYGLLIHYPRWTLYLSTPLGAGMAAFRVLQNLIEDIRNINSDYDAGPGVSAEAEESVRMLDHKEKEGLT